MGISLKPAFIYLESEVPVKLPYGYVFSWQGKSLRMKKKQMLSAVYLNTILLEPA